MLPFLRKNLPSFQQRHHVLCKTMLLSAGIHGLLALIFFISNSFLSVHTIVVRKGALAHNAPLVLVPLARRVGAQAPKPIAAKKKGAGGQVAYSVKKVEPKKASDFAKATTDRAAQKKVVEKKAKAPAAKQTTVLAKKTESKPVVAPKKPVEVAKKQEQKKSPEVKKIVEAPPVPQVVQEEVAMQVGRDELQEIQLYASVYACVEKEWKPPVGIPATSECEISFMIDNEGRASGINVARSSTILMYDTAARLAVARAAFEPYTWGKRCAIVFKI